MPPPTSADEMVNRLRRSGLIPSADLAAYLSLLPPGLPAQGVLDKLVADRMLTPFQADRLAVGKYKGFLLGGYVILDKIGTGGMGQVYLAEHTAMRRLVAVKVLNVPVAEDAVAKERFFREARAAAGLNHPNIVRVYDLTREGQLPYLVMEYVEGLSLQTLVTGQGAVPWGAAADYARQVALGLEHAYENGLVHRDIKPGNLLIDRAGVVRILDFGLVRMDDVDTGLTNQIGGKNILGTADYLAPEQALNSSDVDTRADIYSLGATLYFLLAGHPMFPGGRTAQKLMWQQWKDPTPIRELKPDVPEELAAAVHRAVAKKPEDRFQTPQEMADALAPLAVGPAPLASGLIPSPPVRRWVSAGRGDPGPSSSGLRKLPDRDGGRPRTPPPVRLPPPGLTPTPPMPGFGGPPPQQGGAPWRLPPADRPAAEDTPHAGAPRPGYTPPKTPPPKPRTPAPDDRTPARSWPPVADARPPGSGWGAPVPDPEDVVLGSLEFMMPPRGAQPAPDDAADLFEAAAPAPGRSPPWLAIAMAAGVAAGGAVVFLVMSR